MIVLLWVGWIRYLQGPQWILYIFAEFLSREKLLLFPQVPAQQPPFPPFRTEFLIYCYTKIKILIKSSGSSKWKYRKSEPEGSARNKEHRWRWQQPHNLRIVATIVNIPSIYQEEKPPMALLIRSQRKICSFTPGIPLCTEQQVGQDEICWLLQ